MPRPKTILQSLFPYHVTARCANKEWFKQPMDDIWSIFSEQLTFMKWAFKVEIHSFVLMQNHFHLLVRTPDSNLDKAMAFFMRETSKSFNKKTQRINQCYGGPYFKCIVEGTHYYLQAYKYIYANPIKAGLSAKCESYKYSSLNFLLGENKATFSVTYDDTLFSDIDGTLQWINHRPTDEAWRSVELAMHRKFFKLSRVDSCRKENPLEKHLL